MFRKCIGVVIFITISLYTSITFAKDLPAKQYFKDNVFISDTFTIPTYRISSRVFAVQTVDKSEVIYFEFNKSMTQYKICKTHTLYKNGRIETKEFETKFNPIKEHTLIQLIADSCIINYQLFKIKE